MLLLQWVGIVYSLPVCSPGLAHFQSTGSVLPKMEDPPLVVVPVLYILSALWHDVASNSSNTQGHFGSAPGSHRR